MHAGLLRVSWIDAGPSLIWCDWLSQGFECRGTVLAKRATAWENLLRATRPTGPLSTNPLERPSSAPSAASAHLKKSEHANKQQHKK